MWRCIIRAKHNGHVIINVVMSLMRVSYISRNYASPIEKSLHLPIARSDNFSVSLSLSLLLLSLVLVLVSFSLSPPAIPCPGTLFYRASHPHFSHRDKNWCGSTNESRRMKIWWCERLWIIFDKSVNEALKADIFEKSRYTKIFWNMKEICVKEDPRIYESVRGHVISIGWFITGYNSASTLLRISSLAKWRCFPFFRLCMIAWDGHLNKMMTYDFVGNLDKIR